jgi:hypothetical protein|eukprot:COSAG06_NODE_1558_length_9107_cov_5.238677_1_plen_392_part_00
MPQLVDPTALSALVPPDAISFALEHREQLSALLASTDASDAASASSPMDPTATEAFRLSYQSAFEEALRQSLPAAPAAAAGSQPEPEPEAEPAAKASGARPGPGQPWPTVRPANWPDSKKPVTDDSVPAPGSGPGVPGPKPGTVLWTSRDRRTEVTKLTVNTWGAAEDSPEAMLKALHALGPGGLDATDENGWTCLMWSARLNRPANVSALLRAGATAGLRSTKEVWRFAARRTASQLARLAQEWDGADRSALCLLLEAAEAEEERSRNLQAVYDARTEQVKAGHAAAKKDIVSGVAEEAATADIESSAVASKAKNRTLLREAEAKRIQAEAKAKRALRDAATAHAELAALRAEHARYKVAKEAELKKAREELLEVTTKVRSAELKAAHGL